MSVYNTDKKIKEREGQRWREISQNHGVVEFGWEVEVIWSNNPAQAGTPGAGCPEPCPGSF